jgi:hypothetical protein
LVIIVLDNIESTALIRKNINTVTSLIQAGEWKYIIFEICLGFTLHIDVFGDDRNLCKIIFSRILLSTSLNVRHVDLWSSTISIDAKRFDVHEWHINIAAIKINVISADIAEVIVKERPRLLTVVHQTLDVSEGYHEADRQDGEGEEETLVSPKRQKVLL